MNFIKECMSNSRSTLPVRANEVGTIYLFGFCTMGKLLWWSRVKNAILIFQRIFCVVQQYEGTTTGRPDGLMVPTY